MSGGLLWASTLKHRLFHCHEEVRINGRCARGAAWDAWQPDQGMQPLQSPLYMRDGLSSVEPYSREASTHLVRVLLHILQCLQDAQCLLDVAPERQVVNSCMLDDALSCMSHRWLSPDSGGATQQEPNRALDKRSHAAGYVTQAV